MEKDLISVIVPCYNVSPFLTDFFLSIENINYPNYEVILVDDGSTDDTGKKLDEFSTTHKFSRVIHQKNEGVSAARNRGLKEMRGTYVNFMDPDDCVHPDILKVLHTVISKTNADFASCGYKYVPENFHYVKECKEGSVGKIRFANGKDESLIRYILTFSNSSCMRLFRKDILEKIPNFPNLFDVTIQRSEDEIFNYIYLLHSNSYASCSAKLYYYRVREGSALHTLEGKVDVGFNKIRKKLKSFDVNIYKNSQVYINAYLCLTSMYIMNELSHNRNYHNPAFAKLIYETYCENLPYVKKAKLLPLPHRFGTLFTKPFMYLMIRKKLKG